MQKKQEKNNKYSFVDKVVGKNEQSLKNIKGLKAPSEDEHNKVLNHYMISFKKDKQTSIMWILASIFFIMYHIKMILFPKIELPSTYFTIVFVVFGITIFISYYKAFIRNKKVFAQINKKKYEVKTVKVHHIMPNVLASGGTAVKICDENNIIYFREFVINKNVKKLLKTNLDVDFLLVIFDADRDRYGLILLDDADNDFQKSRNMKKEKNLDSSFSQHKNVYDKNTQDLFDALDNFEKNNKEK